MVIFTQTATSARYATSIEMRSARVDRHRPALSLAPVVAARLLGVSPRTMSPAYAIAMGEVRPDSVVECTKAHLIWQRGTTDNTVFGGFGFDRFANDTQTRVGPPPRCRPSV